MREIYLAKIGSKARDYVNTQVKNREYWRPFARPLNKKILTISLRRKDLKQIQSI